MSVGRCLSPEEARKKKRLDRFSGEHPRKGNKALFKRLLNTMVKV